MKSAVALLSLLTAATSASPLVLLSPRQSSSSVATIRIFSDWPERRNVLQTIESQGQSSVTELGPPAVGVCIKVHDRDRGCRYLAWFDREADDPGAGVNDRADDLTPEGDFPPNSEVEVCAGHVMEMDGVKSQIPLRRVEVVCS
ncbi:hypothetical protein PG994_005408 [Apiospora phragmitis]|uniref:Uncharacterized protein n=1 Tax=Apiospora phragmitis TaxID=2905665 RepID=A0ABR1VC56_9PEZI